jgi:peptidoglycan hydrolase-like protein with peptidoglycan-binding domain
MNARVLALLTALAPAVAFAASPFTALHPEEAIPDPDVGMQSGPHAELISRVQERLRALGFDAGPVNGYFGEKTQAALAQFQLSVPLPASGQLDEATLAHLGVRDYPIAPDASAGSTSDARSVASPEQADTGTGSSPAAGSSPERTAEPKPN